jgi:hypothetical protein
MKSEVKYSELLIVIPQKVNNFVMTYKVTRLPENIIVKKIFLYIVFVLFFPLTLSVQA